MPIRDYIFKIGDGIGHLASGVLAVDCIHNIYQGNYEIATIEGVAATYIQISKILRKQRKRIIDNFIHTTETELIPLIKQTEKDIQKNLQSVIERINERIKEE